MQVQHKAVAHITAQQQVANAGISALEVLGPVLFFGGALAFVGFWCFVMFRFFRWFFRVTR